MHLYTRLTSLYTWNWHNIVNQLHSNKNLKIKILILKTGILKNKRSSNLYHFHSYEAIWTNFHTVTHFFFLCDLPVWFIFLLFLSFETSLFSSSMAGTHYTSVSDTMSEVAQPYPTLCNPMDCSLPGSSVHGIFQAIILEWIPISFSRGSSRPRDRTQVSRLVDRRFPVWATREVHLWY